MVDSDPRTKSLFTSAKEEFIHSPIGTIAAVVSILALLLARPEILNIPVPSSAGAEATDKSGLITWLLLYLATCYFFAKWSALVAKRSVTSGFIHSVVFGVMVLAIGLYLASIYLTSYPIEAVRVGTRVKYIWLGLPIEVASILVASLWVLVLAGVFSSSFTLIQRRGGEILPDRMVYTDVGMVMLYASIPMCVIFSALAYSFTAAIMGLPDAPLTDTRS